MDIPFLEWIFRPNKYNTPHQGKQEKQRRIKQMKNGILNGFPKTRR